MQYIKVFFVALSLVVGQVFPATTTWAASHNVVVQQVQLAGIGTGNAGQEFVTIYNNADSDVDITDWCLTYSSASGATTSTLYCVRSADATTKVWLKARSYGQFVSSDLKNTIGGPSGDGVFTYKNGLSSTGGKIRLIDATLAEVDRVAWGTATGEPTAPEPPAGKVLVRIGNGQLQDTDNSAQDFTIGLPNYYPKGMYELAIDVCPNITGAQSSLPPNYVYNDIAECVVKPPQDACPNIESLQVAVPQGFLRDETGMCQPDSCLNVDGLQSSVPYGYDDDLYGTCTEIDVCLNMPLAQYSVPDGYVLDENNTCIRDLIVLELSEILPNPKGSDTGREFVELYNPSDRAVSLDDYELVVGSSAPKKVSFPPGSLLQPKEYKTFYDSNIGFTLTNTSGRVILQAKDGRVFSDTGNYSSANEDVSWANLFGVWQYTNTATPGGINVYDEDASDEGGVTPQAQVLSCPAGKYRNPLTNRCRNIETDASVLSTCDSDQYRNPETGRCKKVVSAAAVAPCKEGQYRSEETNRCRTISTSSATLTPCKEGQERSPETNRCRTIRSASVPAAAYAVEPVKDSAKVFIGWWALGGIGVVASAYAGWEWRREVIGAIRRVMPFKYMHKK
jgi:hypothetical protein